MPLNELIYKNDLGDVVVGWEQFKGSRKSLEDRVEARVINRRGPGYLISVIADGMGGGNEGELAAQTTIDAIFSYCENASADNIPEMLTSAISSANTMVTSKPVLNGAGSTATVVVIKNNTLYVANVGDSRAYLVRNSELHQLTTDHTKGYLALREGKLTPEGVKNWSKRDDLGIFVGQQSSITVDTRIFYQGKHVLSLDLKQGDGIILCSDGLIKTRPQSDQPFVYDREIISAFLKEKPADAASVLISFARGRQVDDNVSVIVIGVGNIARPLITVPRDKRSIQLGVGIVVGLALLVFMTVLLSQFFKSPVSLQPTETVEIRSGFAYISQTSGSVQSQTKNGWVSLVQGEYTQIGAESFLKSDSGGMAILDLQDGSTIFIGPGTVLSLTSVADPATHNKDTLITLTNGALAVRVSLRAGNTFAVETKDGRTAKVEGSVMSVLVTPTRFEVDCFEGHCSISTKTSSQPILGNQYSWFDGQSLGQIKSPARCDELRKNFPDQDIFMKIGVCVPAVIELTKTLISTETPTLTPVSTLPPASGPDIEATQACKEWLHDNHNSKKCP